LIGIGESNESARFTQLTRVPWFSMNASPEISDLEVTLRFLRRFADLMSTGSNAENLLRAATLIEANVKRANEAEAQLRQVQSNCAAMESRLAALSRDAHAHVQVPVSILRLAASQFQALARAFEHSGNIVSQAMCSASASTLDSVLETHSPLLSLPRSDQTSH
jgi:hypothetical protein